jgi:hypothetical protein
MYHKYRILQVTLIKTRKHSRYKLLTAMGTSAQVTKDKKPWKFLKLCAFTHVNYSELQGVRNLQA